MLKLALLVILASSLATAGMLPVWAQLAKVDGPHVCHCSTDHHGCVCARCGTDADANGHRSIATIKGSCGDNELAFGGRGFVAVLPATSPDVPLVAAEWLASSPLLTRELRRDRRPPKPPPRASSPSA